MSFSRHEDEFQATLRQLVSDLQAVKKKVGDDRSRGIKSCEGLIAELKEMVPLPMHTRLVTMCGSFLATRA